MKIAAIVIACVVAYFAIGGATSVYKSESDPQCWFNERENRWHHVYSSSDSLVAAYWPIYWTWHAGELLSGYVPPCLPASRAD
jgi:hypothetical protein